MCSKPWTAEFRISFVWILIWDATPDTPSKTPKEQIQEKEQSDAQKSEVDGGGGGNLTFDIRLALFTDDALPYPCHIILSSKGYATTPSHSRNTTAGALYLHNAG